MLTIDSFAWIEVIRGSSIGATSRDLMDASDGCFTPSFVLAEVAHRCRRDRLDELVVRQALWGIAESSKVVPIDAEIAIAGAAATAELRRHARAVGPPVPGLGEGLVLATARLLGSQLLTGDAHFRGLPETVWLE